MRQPLRQRITGTTNTSTAVDVSIPQIKAGQTAYVTHLALQNASGESVDVLFGILNGSTFQQIWAKQTVADGDAIGVLLTFALLEGDKLTARVTGSAKSSTVTFIVSGSLEDQTPEVVEVVASP
jgi:hypothetical protein